MLCICRGIQILNVACGGSLLQHIKNHQQDEERYIATHEVEINTDTILNKIFGKEKIKTNTFHHQAIKQLGDDLKIAAKNSDGIIEAVEHISYPDLLGVQWHPESFSDIYDNEHKKIFDWFISRAGGGLYKPSRE